MKQPVALALFSSLFFAACGGSSGDISGTGIFKLGITDAPVDDADAVVVSISAVHLVGEDDTDAQSFEFDPPRSIDLLALQGGLSDVLVGDQAVPVGTYPKLRLVVEASNPSCNNLTAPFPSYITIDGTDYPLVVPSGAQSGLKINGPIVVESGALAAYTVDFDLRKSIAQRGATGCYNLRPTLRVVENTEVGSLTGRVSADLLNREQCSADVVTGSGAAVYVYNGALVEPDDVGSNLEPVATALLEPLADESGDFSYRVGFLAAGNYTAAFTCQAADDDPEANDDILFDGADSVSIEAGGEAQLDFALGAAAP